MGPSDSAPLLFTINFHDYFFTFTTTFSLTESPHQCIIVEITVVTE